MFRKNKDMLQLEKAFNDTFNHCTDSTVVSIIVGKILGDDNTAIGKAFGNLEQPDGDMANVENEIMNQISVVKSEVRGLLSAAVEADMPTDDIVARQLVSHYVDFTELMHSYEAKNEKLTQKTLTFAREIRDWISGTKSMGQMWAQV